MASSTSELVDKIKRYKLHLTNDQEAAKIQKTLKKLKALEITVDVLAATGIGKIVNSLRRHELAGDLAKTLVRDWKKLLPKDSKSPTTDEFPCAIKLDKEKVVAADLNNNCLFDVKEVGEPVNQKIKKDRNTDETQNKRTSVKDSFNKIKVSEKRRKKNICDQSDEESPDETRCKSYSPTNILGKGKSKCHKRKAYQFSDNESDSGSDKKPVKRTKPKTQLCPEQSRKRSKHEGSPVRHSETQKKKKKPSLKCKGKSPVSKNKKREHEEKVDNSDAEEPTMSFESYLSYDHSVTKRRERPKPNKHLSKSKPVFRKETKKVVTVPQYEEPSNEPMKCLPVPVCPDSPIKITSQCIIQIPESPPLESWFPEVENNPKRKDDSYDILEESAVFTGQRLNKKMQVYSGAKTVFLPAMMSLYQQCIRTLQNNINLLYETGGVPFEILQPVLERCTPEQLLRIEEYNPIYIGETDHLWGKHCQRDFKDAKLLEYESWKEMYIRLSEERERKFKRLTKTISSAQSTKPQGRQVKMAFIHSVAKPPRDVRIKQEIHGTAVQQPLPKCSVKPVHDSRPRQMPKESFSRISTTSTSTSSTSQDPRKKTKVAPMMAKSLKAFKKQFGRR
ncbi:unnamed protein product [Knipowitschia caucasica]